MKENRIEGFVEISEDSKCAKCGLQKDLVVAYGNLKIKGFPILATWILCVNCVDMIEKKI